MRTPATLESNPSSPRLRPNEVGQRLLRHEHVVALVVASLTVSLVFFEVVFAGKSMLPPIWGVMGFEPPWGYPGELPTDNYHVDMGASAWQIETSIHKIREAFSDGRVPLWNSSEGTGQPLLAHPVTAVFNPLKLPVLLSSDPLAWDIYLIGRYIIGAFAMFLFARLMGLGIAGALTSAVGFTFSGSFIIYSNNWWLDVYFTLPMLLYAVERIVRRPDAMGGVLLGAAVALNLHAGMPEPSFVTILMAGTYGLVRLIATARRERATSPAVLRVCVLSAGFLGGFLLAAPVLVPFVEYEANSYSPHTSDEMLGLQHFTWAKLLNTFVPYFNGPPPYAAIRGYVGIALPFLALLGLRYHLGRRHVGWFFVAVLFFAVAKTHGLPIVNEIGRLPLSVLMIWPTYLAPIIAFVTAFLAGMGVDRIAHREKLGREPLAAAAVLGIVILGLFVCNLDLYGTLPKSAGPWLLFALGTFATITTVVLLRRLLPGPVVAAVCLGVVAVELIVLAPSGVYRDRYDTFAKPPYVEYLQKQQATEGRSRLFGYDALLFPNDASAFDLEDVRAITSLYPKRYMTYIREFISPLAVSRFEGGQHSIDEEGPTLVRDNRMFDLMGVRYILARDTLLPTGPASPGAITQTRNDRVAQFELVYDAEVKIYRNNFALDRAFVVPEVEAVSDGDKALARMHQSGFDPARTAVVETDALPPELSSSSTTSGTSRITISAYDDQRVQLQASMARPGLAVLTDTYFPGWKAYVDGKRVEILQTDYLFRGVVVPAGEHEVRFEYAPSSFTVGLGLAAIGLIGFAAWWGIQRYRQRNSTGTS